MSTIGPDAAGFDGLTPAEVMVFRFVRGRAAAGEYPTAGDVRRGLGMASHEAARNALKVLAIRGRLRRGSQGLGCPHHYPPDGHPGGRCPACRAAAGWTPGDSGRGE